MSEYSPLYDFSRPDMHRHTGFNKFIGQVLQFPFLNQIRFNRLVHDGEGFNGATVLQLTGETRTDDVMRALENRGWYNLGTVNKWERFQQDFVAPPGITAKWMDELTFASRLGQKGFQYDKPWFVHPSYRFNGLILPLPPAHK